MRPTIDDWPSALLYLRSGWVLYRNNVHSQWKLERRKGQSEGGYFVKADTVEQLERERKIAPRGPNEYRIVEG